MKNKRISVAAMILFFFVFSANASRKAMIFDADTLKTDSGDLEITFVGHASLILRFLGKTIQVDPWSKLADYTQFEKADLILLTHEHFDHFNMEAINTVRTKKTKIVLTERCAEKLAGIVMRNGDIKNVDGLEIEAVPAYNIVHTREGGIPYHPKGVGNGYVVTFGNKKVYIAGDTENIPEMKNLKDIDAAFLPMNIPYTMTPEMVADAARMFRPKRLYPYHFRDTDTSKIIRLLKSDPDIEVVIKKM